jgi:hypothetical protein
MIRFARQLRSIAALSMLSTAAMLAAAPAHAQARDYPTKPVELVVPFQPAAAPMRSARAFADATRKHMPQSMIVVNKPGRQRRHRLAGRDQRKPDGYRLAVVTVELTTLPHMGYTKFTYDDFAPIARLNADQAAITVRADAPWNTVEEFLAAAKKEARHRQRGQCRQRLHLAPGRGQCARGQDRHQVQPHAVPGRRPRGAGAAGRPHRCRRREPRGSHHLRRPASSRRWP